MSQFIIDITQAEVTNVFPSQSVTTSGAGSSFDCQDSELLLGAILQCGSVTGTTPGVNVQIENYVQGAWTAITSLVFAQVTTKNIQTLVGVRNGQFVRANVTTVTGTSPNASINIVLVAGGHLEPQKGGYDSYPAAVTF
jgi:hypothetical protein